MAEALYEVLAKQLCPGCATGVSRETILDNKVSFRDDSNPQSGVTADPRMKAA